MSEAEEVGAVEPQVPEPQLEVRWTGRAANLWEALRTLRTRLPLLPARASLVAFHDAFLAPGLPIRAFVLSVALHVLFILLPLPEFLTRPPAQNSELSAVRIEYDLRWAGTARVLPPISPAPPTERPPSPGGKENEPLPPPGAEIPQAQTIVSNPPQPNNPRQTLLQQFALDKARVDVRDLKLPNMVIPPSATPASEIDLRRLRIPNAPLDLTGPPQAPLPPKPKTGAELAMENTELENVLARLTVAPSTPGEGPATAPDVGAALGPGRSGDLAAPGLLALSAEPGIAGPVLKLPDSNLRARFTAGPYAGSGSPGGVPGGVPGAEGGRGGGPGGEASGGGGLTAPGIFVAPAGPTPAGPVIVGLGGGTGQPAAPPPAARPSTEASSASGGHEQKPAKTPQERAEELLEGLRPGTRPTTVAHGRHIYTIYINMPNLTSQAGSWVLRFAELGADSTTAPGGAADSYPLEAPVPVKKVDPRYPAAARRDGVEGIVFLYGIIRQDGGVEEVQVVRGVHALLDQSAVDAFQRWRFEPGRKNGASVPLEVVVEIPFRLTKLF